MSSNSNLDAARKGYAEIFSVIEKHKSRIAFDVPALEAKAENHLLGLELMETYGFNIDPETITSTDWQNLKDNVTLMLMDGANRAVAWPDDGRQPRNERLLEIHFSTGAYILGPDCPRSLFQRFFDELKTYGPLYIDSGNKALYFGMHNAGKIYNDYDEIIKRYKDESARDFNARRIEKMKAEIAELEADASKGDSND